MAAVTVSYAFADGALLRVEGDALRVLDVERRGPSPLQLDPDVEDGMTRDAGDFRVSTLFRLLGSERGPSAGLDLEVKLPNSSEEKGIGTNTTDFTGSVFGSWGGGPLRVTGEVGIGILEAPLDDFEQNDVVSYAAEALFRPAGSAFRVALGARGRESTRGVVPPGTEDRGELRAGAEYLLGGWQLDAGLSVGYAGTSADWRLTAGIAGRP